MMDSSSDTSNPVSAPAGNTDRPSASGSASIVARLRRKILDGHYSYNERLPSERQLAEDFNAARGTVREALRQLEEMNLVIRRVGSGTFIKYREQMDQDAIAMLTSPLELIDVRYGIEPQLARLAVVNASARDITRLQEALERVEASGEDRELFTRADAEFHLSVAECTRNPLMLWLYRHINDVRSHSQWSSMKDKILSPECISEYNAQHRDLFNAIASRDIAAAVNAVRAHLEKARRDLLGAEHY